MAIFVLKAPKCPLTLRTREEMKGDSVRGRVGIPEHFVRHPSQPDCALNGRLSGF